MDITQETVLQWLDANHRSQKWLSEQCGVTDQAISNWLREKNPRKIPAQAIITIRRLMEEDAAAAAGKPPHALVLEFADNDYSAIENAALADRKTIREWARDTLLDAASMDVDAVAKAIKLPSKTSLEPGSTRELLNASLDAMVKEIEERIKSQRLAGFHPDGAITIYDENGQPLRRISAESAAPATTDRKSRNRENPR